MVSSISITARTVDGRTLEQLQRAVALREKYLGETTSNAATATMIRALESIRKVTKVANPKNDTGFFSVGVAPGMTAGWRREGGHNRRCILMGGSNDRWKGHRSVYNGDRQVVNKAGAFVKGEVVNVYIVQDLHAKDPKTAKPLVYYILARDAAIATQYAKNRHENRVKAHAGMAKASLGSIMHDIFGKGLGVGMSQRVKRIVNSVNKVRKNISGFGSGCVGLYVLDGLDYAIPAVDGGATSINTAVQRAVNGIVGQINAGLAKQAGADRSAPFKGKLDIPFQEIARK